MNQRSPEDTGELAANGGDDELFRFAAGSELAIAAMQASHNSSRADKRAIRRRHEKGGSVVAEESAA